VGDIKGQIAKIFTSRGELTLRNIRVSKWAEILAFPLPVIFSTLRLYEIDATVLGLQNYEYLLYMCGFGWLTLFFMPRQWIIPALRVCATLCAVLLPFQFLLSGSGLLAVFLVWYFLLGVCIGAGLYLFCFTLNNVERLLAAAIIQFDIGFTYCTLSLSIPSFYSFMVTWGSGILMAIFIAAVFCCHRKKANEETQPDQSFKNNFNSVVFVVILLYTIYYVIWNSIHFMLEWIDNTVNIAAFGIGGSLFAIALLIIIYFVINRSALYSWLFFLVFSLLGLSILLLNYISARDVGSFIYGLGDGIGYITIMFMCGSAIKQSKSLKMYRIFCLMNFVNFNVIAVVIRTVYNSNFIGQSHILAFGIVLALCLICFLLFPYLQRKIFDAPWTDGLKLSDMEEYAPAIAETEKLDAKEQLDLSPREKEIFTMLLTDLQRKHIADTLKISEGTVNFHVNNLYHKLGIQSRAELFAKYGKYAKK
jgi:DNA-binding NarL/FixJ family response regulator